MNRMNNSLIHDVQTYILEHGTIIDVLRLASAGYDLPAAAIDEALEKLKISQNNDGGIPFDLARGNPSSAKLTAEVLPLLLRFRELYPDLTSQMVSFMISRIIFSHEHPAVDMQHLARQIVRERAGQKQHGVGHVFRRAWPF